MTTRNDNAPGQSLSVTDGIAIMVGIVIGIGIFQTPPLIANNVGSGAAFLGVWVLGGIITLIGALCYAELASAYPNAGGEYHFLNRAYGRHVSTLFAWARGTVIQTGAIAAVAFVFGDYASNLLPLGPYGSAIYAALVVIILTALNLTGTFQGKTTQNVLTTLTLVAMAAVVLAGFFSGASAPAPAASASGAGALGLAMVFVLLTYGGWNEAAYLSAEVKDAKRNIVRVLVGGTVLLVAIYLLVNAAYLAVFGLEGLRASRAVAADLMRLAVGEAGAVVITLIVLATSLSTLNATIFTGARTLYALGRDLPVLGKLGIWSEKGGNPANAILIQGVIALALVGLGTITKGGFKSMVDYTAPVFWFFLLLVGIALFVLRQRDPGIERPFRVPLYPITPILFCLTCGYMLYSSLAYTGFGALVGVAVLVAGLPLLLFGGNRPAAAPAE